MTNEEETELFLDMCQFLRDHEAAGNDISNVNWVAMDELAEQFLCHRDKVLTTPAEASTF